MVVRLDHFFLYVIIIHFDKWVITHYDSIIRQSIAWQIYMVNQHKNDLEFLVMHILFLHFRNSDSYLTKQRVNQGLVVAIYWGKTIYSFWNMKSFSVFLFTCPRFWSQDMVFFTPLSANCSSTSRVLVH